MTPWYTLKSLVWNYQAGFNFRKTFVLNEYSCHYFRSSGFPTFSPFYVLVVWMPPTTHHVIPRRPPVTLMWIIASAGSLSCVRVFFFSSFTSIRRLYTSLEGLTCKAVAHWASCCLKLAMSGGEKGEKHGTRNGTSRDVVKRLATQYEIQLAYTLIRFTNQMLT